MRSEAGLAYLRRTEKDWDRRDQSRKALRPVSRQASSALDDWTYRGSEWQTQLWVAHFSCARDAQLLQQPSPRHLISPCQHKYSTSGYVLTIRFRPLPELINDEQTSVCRMVQRETHLLQVNRESALDT